jgi:Xaa-Pro aminopeptidase
MKDTIKERIASLRRFMQKKQINAFIIPSTDPHAGEYVPEHWEARKWLSGFTGSAGTLVITEKEGGLWTDSRYFLQAEEQLNGTGIDLQKEGLSSTPSIAEWLGEKLQAGSKIGIDGWVNSISTVENLSKQLLTHQLTLISTEDPFTSIWENRPSIPENPIFILPLEYAGVPCQHKILQIQELLQQKHTEGLLLSALDEIAWTLNLRGNDVHCNPVFVSYLLITNRQATLYISPKKLTDELTEYLQQNNIIIKDYKDIISDLSNYKEKNIQLSPSTNYALYQAASSATHILQEVSPVVYLKAVKNDTEISGIHQAMKRDGVAMVRFLKWIKEAVQQGSESEISISNKLYEFRNEQALFKGISFDTIAGYQQHGAIVHYEATPDTDISLKPEGLLLLDSGGQYMDGTTDITRTIALGAVSQQQKIDYTLVLKGFIALSQAVFPHGTCGTQLDVLARQYMWKAGINYGHGTGHGVGHFLNVHEGPHQIRMNHMPSPLLPGMTITNEPGIYRSGEYGIRTENTMLVVKDNETSFGTFYRFEPLTLCPIDKEAICKEMMTGDEVQWLNNYHTRVYKELSPLLSPEERIWLENATSAL